MFKTGGLCGGDGLFGWKGVSRWKCSGNGDFFGVFSTGFWFDCCRNTCGSRKAGWECGGDWLLCGTYRPRREFYRDWLLCGNHQSTESQYCFECDRGCFIGCFPSGDVCGSYTVRCGVWNNQPVVL